MSVIASDWPPEVSWNDYYTNLALITSKTENGNRLSTMEYDYIHGKIDNIIAYKESIKLNEVFYPSINPRSEESRLTILMDGAPGVGKTTITRKLCIEWAKGEMLQEYQLVILIVVREVINLSEEASIFELFPSESVASSKEIALNCLKNTGKRLLFLFDGYDETSETSRSERSLLSQIILGKKLHSCSVLITSRPHASGYFKSHTRFNRHVEVLGFSAEKISQYIHQNLSDANKANRLIQMLKDRLDIVSLCYIPLNCRIVLFVYRILEYELPETLTKLYEIFILHTIKRHTEKVECSLDRKAAIQRANHLLSLPMNIIEQINVICKLAFDGMIKGEVSFSDEEVKDKSILNLGLINSYQSITSLNVQRHFHFLHLNIQEFLAAMFLASSTLDKVRFYRDYIDNNRFRMTMLFLAGLTRLNFHTDLSSSICELAPYLKFDTVSNTLDELQNEMHPTFLLCAHCAYEAQIDSSSDILLHLFPIQSKAIKFDKPVSPFEALTIAHYLASTPASNVWEKIDFSEANLPINSILFSEHHKKESVLAIAMTKVLRIGTVVVPTVRPFFETVQELSFVLKTVTHVDLTNLCEYLSQKQIALNHLEIYSTKDSSTLHRPFHLLISKTQISLNLRDSIMCSNSFNKLLQFVDCESLELISISRQSTAFADCEECHSNGYDTLSCFCQFLEQSTAISSIDLTNCALSTATVDLLVAAYSKCSQPSKLKTIDLRENYLTSTGHLPNLLTFGNVSVSACDFEFKSDEKNLKICGNDCTLVNDYQLVFETFIIPQAFSKIQIYVNQFHFRYIISFLQRNDHIKNISLSTKEYSANHRCKTVTLFAEVLSNQKHMQSFFSSNVRLTRSTLSIEWKPEDSLKLNMCAGTLKKFLCFLTEEVKVVSISGYPEVFENCERCEITVDNAVDTLCELISKSKRLHHLRLFNTNLSEKLINLIVQSIPSETSHVTLHGNIASAQSVNRFVSNLISQKRHNEHYCIGLYGYLITFVGNPLTLFIKEVSGIKKDFGKLLNCLSLPKSTKKLQLCCTDYSYQLRTAAALLSNNSQIIQLVLDDATFHLHENPEFAELVELLSQHPAMEELVCNNKFGEALIVLSQTKLWLRYAVGTNSHSLTTLLPNLRDQNEVHIGICSKTFIQCLSFLKDVESIDISQQILAFRTCDYCTTSSIAAITSLCTVLGKSRQLKHLNLSRCELSPDDVEKLSIALSEESQLEYLFLDGNNSTLSALTKFFRLMFISSLNHLHLANVCYQYCRLTRKMSFEVDREYFKSAENFDDYLSPLINFWLKVPVKVTEFQLFNVDLSHNYSDLFDQLLGSVQTECSIRLVDCSLPYSLLRTILLAYNICYLTSTWYLHLQCSPIVFTETTAFNSHSIFDRRSEPFSEQINKSGSSNSRHLLLLSANPSSVDLCLTDLLQCLKDGLLQNRQYSLDISDNDLTDPKRSKSLKMILDRSNLMSLNLSKCETSLIGIDHLAIGLQSNQTLQDLIIDSLCIIPTEDQDQEDQDQNSQDRNHIKSWEILFRALKQSSSIITHILCENKLFQGLIDLIRRNKLNKTLKEDNWGFTENHMKQVTAVSHTYILNSQAKVRLILCETS